MKYATMKSENRAAKKVGHGYSAALIVCCLTIWTAPSVWGQGAGLSATSGTLERTLSGAGSTISFSSQVAPLLNKHCGNCHVRSSKGDFSMASFGRLAAASGVVSPGNPNDSKLVTMIESGKMPPKGEVPPDVLSTIKKWVESGAAFDGNDRNASLASMGGSAAPAGEGAATGRGSAGPRGGSSRPPSSSDGGYGGGSGGGGDSYDMSMEDMDMMDGMEEEDMYGDDMYEDDYGSGYGGPSGGRRGIQSDAELTYIQNFKSVLGDAAWSSLIAPAPPEMAVATGPILKRDAEQAFAAGNYPLALELYFGHMAAEYPDSLVDLQTVKYSQLLSRPVWNIRLGASMSVRGTTSGDRDPIRETASGRRVAQAGPAGRGGRQNGIGDQGYGDGMDDYGPGMDDYGDDMDDYGDDMDMEDYGSGMDDYEADGGSGSGGRRRPSSRTATAAPKRTMLGPDAKDAMDKTLGLVSQVIGDEFTKRFKQGDFGPILITVEPPPEEETRPNRNVRPDPTEEPALPPLGPMSADLSQLLEEVPETMPMWIPAVVYLGEGASSNDLLPMARADGLDLLIHFDVVLKEGRAIQGRAAEVQNISRCRLIQVDTGKTIVTSKGMDNREAAQLAAAGRSGEKAYVEDQLASLLAVVDQKVKATELPPLTAEVARKRVASLMQRTATPSLRTLAEVRLFQALGLIDDAEVEIAFEIIGGPEALMILHGPQKEKLAMVRKWALRSQGARLRN
jgi:hypothetical protein